MKTLFISRSGRKGRHSGRRQASRVSKPKQSVSVQAGSFGNSGGWQRHELEREAGSSKHAPQARSAKEVASVSSRIPSGMRVRRGLSSELPSETPRPPGSSPGTLEVIRCRGFASGSQETRLADGTVQMRLPLGEWILALKTAQEIEAEKSSH